MERSQNRIYFLDYLRGFMILLVVLDHSMHAYSEHYGNTFFFKDIDRSIFVDILHLHNDAIMMPFMFFLAGLFVLPSLQRRGYISYLNERLIRLVIPFIFGIFLISPFMTFHKFIIRQDLNSTFIDFWWDHYIRWQDMPFENLSQGGFWFLYYLFILTIGALVLYAVVPKIFNIVGLGIQWCVERPVTGFIITSMILAIVLGLSDLNWGAPWWIGFKPVFHVRGSRFIAKILFFVLGVGVSQSGLLQNQVFLNRLATSWKQWVGLTCVITITYITVTLVYFNDGAYNDEFRHYVHSDEYASWFDDQAWELLREKSLLVLTRTTLLALTMLSLSLMYISLFKKFFDKSMGLWQSLAVSSFGIYILHEPITTGMQLWLYGTDVDPIIKFILVGATSLSISWIIVDKVLLRVPIFRRIL